MIKILHISPDDKFFDSLYQLYVEDGRYDNSNIIYTDNKQLKLAMVKNEGAHPLCERADIKKILMTSDYDVVYFYSLPASIWWMVDYVPKEKIIIWWAWGFDLYYKYRGLEPFIRVPLFKSMTEKIALKEKRGVIDYLRNVYHRFIVGPYIKRKSKVLLSRIDYFQPVISTEYDIMKRQYPFFRAEKYLSYANLPPVSENYYENKTDNVLIGNSATFSNNHLDILKLLKNKGIDEERFIIPLNYGLEKQDILDPIKNFVPKAQIIESFLDKNVYFDLIDQVGYAIFGVMRQQAMGNIYHLLLVGAKVFLYKDSIPYQHLINKGYYVFPIEDVNQVSLSEPLSEAEIMHNYKRFMSERQEILALHDSISNELQKRLAKS